MDRGESPSAARKLITGTVFQVLVLLAGAVLLLAFLTWPTVDFDEGYFFHAGVHATQSGRPGLPWMDLAHGGPHVYLPLNGLVPLIDWPLAYLPQRWWLFAGRLVSAVAVCAGILLLYAQHRAHARSVVQAGVVVFMATCLPLLLIGRMIRPDAVAFLCLCLALYLAFARRSGLATGLAVAFAFLAHGVHGFLAGLIMFGAVAALPASSARDRVARLGAYGAGAALPVVLFYGVYCLFETPQAILDDARYLIGSTPHWVGSYAPGENIAAWFSFVRAQASLWPLFLFAALAVAVPTDAAHQNRAAIRVLKAAIVGVMLFWIFIYAKKSYSVVVVLLPLACTVLFAARPRWPRLLACTLIVCLCASLALTARYHWRLAHRPPGLAQLAPVAEALARDGLTRPGARVLGKLWLLFVLPPDVTLWDAAAMPLYLGRTGGWQAGIKEAVAQSDGVIVDTEGVAPLDGYQAEIYAQAADLGWRATRVRTQRYFVPAEVVILAPPGK